MSVFTDIADAITVSPSYVGYPPTGALPPYAVLRPYVIDTAAVSLTGEAIAWDSQFSIYCCGASVEASFNLASLVMTQLQGARIGGTTLSTSMGYVGAQVEGHYETQITVQLNQGGIA